MATWIAVFDDEAQKDACVRALRALPDGDSRVHIARESIIAPVIVLESLEKRDGLVSLIREGLQDRVEGKPFTLEPDVPFTLCTIQARAMLNVDVADLSIYGPFDGDGVTVAIVDGGIDDTHADLAGKVVGRWKGSAISAPIDAGHGTMIAGLVCGSGQCSNEKHAGMAPSATLLDCIAFDGAGHGWLSDIIGALEFAALHGAKVACMAFTSNNPLEGKKTLETIMKTLHDERGVILCCGTGNGGMGGKIGMPGASQLPITVASTTRSSVAPFSTRGSHGERQPDLALPGQGIISANVFTSPFKDEPLDENEYYAKFSGNSVSIALLTGLVVKILSVRELDPPAIKRVLIDSCVPVKGATRRDAGAGIPDIEALFTMLKSFFPVKNTPFGVSKNSSAIALVLTFTIFAFALMIGSFL